MENKVHIKDVITFGGALIAFCIGSGFASGQEIMQFFSAHGTYGSLGAGIITLVLFMWFGSRIMEDGRKLKLKSSNSIFKYYCGNILGTFFEWFTPMFLFMVFVLMISGAGATLTDYYGLSPYVGRLLMAVLALSTVLLGLNNVVRIIGYIGPIIVILCIGIGLVSIIQNPEGVVNANQTLNTISVSKAAPTWWLSGLLYAAYSVVGIAPFLAGMGATAKNCKDTLYSGIFAGLAFVIAIMLMNYGLLANIADVYTRDVPSIFVADKIFPAIAVIFTFILMAGIYTTAVPMLWSVCNRLFTDESSKQFKITAVIVTILAFIGGQLPFGKLVGIVYPYTGYLGLVLFACMFYKQFINKDVSTTVEDGIYK